MALIGNRSVLHKSPGRFLNGGHAIQRSAFNKHGMQRGAGFDAKAATPYGYLSPSAWVLPRTAGGMSSRNVTGLSFAASGLAVGGITADGTASFSVSVADAVGQLIVSGEGSASFAFTVADALLTASVNGVGSASFGITSTALLGALASGEGAASFSINVPNAQAYPLNDASPLRTGSASFAINGSLVPYAIGQMSGSTVDTSVLTGDAIAAAVWSALAVQYPDGATMGGKLNTASSGGVDYAALGLAVWGSVERTLTSGAGTAPTAEEVAAAVLAAAQASPMSANMVQVKGQTITGAGSEADPWGP